MKPTTSQKPDNRPLRELWVIVALAAFACAHPAPAERPTADLPEYNASEAARFNDSLAPQIFGAGDRHISGAKLADLRDGADHIVPVRLATLTREKSGGKIRYRLALVPAGPPLDGPELEQELEVSVSEGSPSLSLLRSLDAEAVGSTFIVFLKRYQSNGEPHWHFAAFPDTPVVRALGAAEDAE